MTGNRFGHVTTPLFRPLLNQFFETNTGNISILFCFIIFPVSGRNRGVDQSILVSESSSVSVSIYFYFFLFLIVVSELRCGFVSLGSNGPNDDTRRSFIQTELQTERDILIC